MASLTCSPSLFSCGRLPLQRKTSNITHLIGHIRRNAPEALENNVIVLGFGYDCILCLYCHYLASALWFPTRLQLHFVCTSGPGNRERHACSFPCDTAVMLACYSAAGWLRPQENNHARLPHIHVCAHMGHGNTYISVKYVELYNLKPDIHTPI